MIDGLGFTGQMPIKTALKENTGAQKWPEMTKK